MTIEEDAAAKQNARRQSDNEAAASKPGAQRVAADEAARLDQRIAEKQATSPTTTAPAMVAPNVRNELSQFEQDIESKNAARASAAEVKPGAVAERSSATTARTQLSELENDVAAKNRARRPASELTELEEDVEAKSRARASGPAATTPGARTELNQLESAVAGKSRQMGGAPSTAGSGRAELADLESAVAAKTAAENRSAPAPTTTSNVQPLDDAIENKLRSYDNHNNNNNSLYDEKENYVKDDYNVDSKYGYDYAPEVRDDKYGEAQESAPPLSVNHVNTASVTTTTADHGIIREPDVEFGVMHQGGVEGLAVAVAVTEDEDDAFIPAAVEYDPDAKPPLYKNRRFRLYAFGALLLVVIVAVGVAIAVTQTKGKGNHSAPTSAPTTLREKLGIRDQLQLVVGEQNLADTTTTYYKAMDWIINKDPMKLGPNAENLIQRYLSALFYYSTIEFGPWLSCNPAEKGQDETCNWARLVTVFPNTYQQVPWIRWLSSHHECEWAGVFCDEFNQTRALELYGQQMSGSLPVDIVNFPFLQSVSFDWNNFYGTLPDEWGQMKHLLNVEVHYNFLTGSIPASWWRAETLQRLNLGSNQLSGAITSDISGLTLLKGFFTFDNNLNGTFPTEIGDLEFLSYTRHSKNLIGGQLPTELGNLVNLREFWAHRTAISGTIPSELGKLSQLQDFRAYYTGLEGTFPDEFYNMTFLTRYEIYNCNITGTLSTLVGNLNQLQMLHLRNNEMSGTIPAQLGNLTGLADVWLQGNRFVGSIPQSVCALHVPFLEADCSNTNGVGVPAVTCTQGCCSSCCDQGTGICLGTTQ